MDAGKRQEAISHGEGQGDIGISRQYFATAGAHVDLHSAQLKELESSLSMQAHTSRYVDSHVHAWHACATQVSNWFVNARKRIWQQMLEDEFGREQASTMMGGPAAKSPMGKGNHKSRCCVSADRPDLFFFKNGSCVCSVDSHAQPLVSNAAGKISKGRKEVQPKADPAGSAALSLLSSLMAQGGVAGLSGLEAQTLANISLLQQLQAPQSTTEGAPAASVGGTVGGT